MRALFVITGLVLSVTGVFMMTTAQDPPPKGRTVLVWATDDTPVRRAQIELFNRQNPDLELRMDPTNRNPNKVVVQSLGGVGPDVFDVPGTALPIFVQSGIALDVTDLLKEKGIDARREIWPAAEPLYVFNDRVYGVPANLDSLAVYYNRALFREAGVPPPSENPTWEELIDLGKRMSVREPDGRPSRFGMLFWWDWRDFFSMMGARVFSSDGTTITVDTPEARAAVSLMRDLVFEHRVAPTPSEQNAMATAGGWGGGNENRFAAGRAAMVLGPRYFTANFRRTPGLDVGVVNLPLAKNGATRVRGRTIAVNRRSPRRAEALRFLVFAMQADYNRLNNDLADGVGPAMRFTEEAKFRFNPEFPKETSNPTWRRAMLQSRPDDTSPFLTNSDMDRAVMFQMDLVSQGTKEPAEALAAAQAEAERLLAVNLRRNPDLRAKRDALQRAAR